VLINYSMKKISIRNRDSQKVLGVISSLTMLGFASSVYPESNGLAFLLFAEGEDFPALSLYLLFAALFLTTAIFGSLVYIQAGLFFLLSAVHSGQDPTRHLGLGFAIVAAVILLRRGWFFRKPAIKAVITSTIGVASIVVPVLASSHDAGDVDSALIWALVFIIVVIGLARSRCLSALAPKKRVLRLADFHLTEREKLVVRMRISGMSAKEIAREKEMALSTVRNVLSRSYRKLGIDRCEDLMAMGERYTVE